MWHEQMPPKGQRVRPQSVALLVERWIDEVAPWPDEEAGLKNLAGVKASTTRS